ncbi:hypothetical protein CONPUDRAFT_93407 [Coniophora puteana RWD-64-598 SS2]|uniref:GH3 middle domain-containing protein n=1 Tax=Coniophora puteana (strain RWD-64-598) TaxID=741705 RepID=A0A5M3MA50_CONPW|nr:uncharacterized protein CONPUDRAFT_93407 [Coniophora puteana RWD-64-598 SS2]EIW75714.1 hypothetical protein CONPUDRAFT_93407 [Coniophora puteana RWD-64-598 SS2]
MSGSTSGKAPKLIPMYGFRMRLEIPSSKACNPTFTGYMKFAEVRNDDESIMRIPIAVASGYWTRAACGFDDFERDKERLAEMVPGTVAPFGAGLIVNYRSLLLTHAAFALAERSVDVLFLTWSTTVIDFMQWVDEEWEALLEGIEKGKLPHFPETEEVHAAIATKFHADPERAEELRKIGPPSGAAIGWAKKTWPSLNSLWVISTGAFERPLPKVRAFVGSDVRIATPGYFCTESPIAGTFGDEAPSLYKVLNDNYIELLEVLGDGEDGAVKQLWEVEYGKLYEPVFTTYDGLWRYRIQDAVQVVGFDPADGAPVLKYKERRNLSIMIPNCTLITSSDITESIADVEGLRHAEFTTFLDDRVVPSTVGFFIETTQTIGTLSSLDRDVIWDALVETNGNFATGAQRGFAIRPTIRILAPGTFAEFRHWRGSLNDSGSSQIKVPLITLDLRSQEFFLGKVIDEVH